MSRFQKTCIWLMMCVLLFSLAGCDGGKTSQPSSQQEPAASQLPASSEAPDPPSSSSGLPPSSGGSSSVEAVSEAPQESLPPLEVEDMKPFDSKAPKAKSKAVALTFDDGPGRKTTRHLIEELNERGAKATFFVLGSRVDAYPDVVQYAYESGHQIGNHSYDHKNLTKLPQKDMLKQITDTDEAVKRVTGYITSYIRPPGGNHNETVDSRMGRPIVLWSIDPKDWKYKDANRIYNKIITNVKDGDIILLHDIYSTSVDAAIRVVDTLSQQGYSFVTLDELFALKGKTPEAGVTYNGLHFPNVQP